MNYKPFLIQKERINSIVRDSMEWDIMVKSFPFKVYGDVKDLPKRDWIDEHGDDDFLPDNPTLKAYEIECEFLFNGEHGTANTQIRSFIEYLNKDGYFRIYDTYTDIGRQKVRYISNDKDIFHRREGNNDLVVFKLKLKVNDPLTQIKLSK